MGDIVASRISRATPRGVDTSSPQLRSLAALAQHSRLEIYRLLLQRGSDGVAAGAIADSLQAPQNTVSSHLSVLARAGLIRGERQGRRIIYRANLERIRSLVDYLVADWCRGPESRAEIHGICPVPKPE